MSDALKRLFERAKHRAVKEFNRERELTPFLIVQKPDGRREMVTNMIWQSPAEKYAMVALARAKMTMDGIDLYAFANEVWFSPVASPAGFSVEQAEAWAREQPRPSERVDRKDAVMVIAERREPRLTFGGMFPIIRDGWKTRLGAFEDRDEWMPMDLRFFPAVTSSPAKSPAEHSENERTSD